LTLYHEMSDHLSASERLRIIDQSVLFRIDQSVLFRKKSPCDPGTGPGSRMAAAVFDFTCQPLHRSELTSHALELALNVHPTTWDDNPFVAENDALFLRFDALEMRNSGRDNGVYVGFLWKGTVMCWLNAPGVRLEGGNMLNLRGIEGRQRVMLR
jgi:hypothetical protein